MGEEESIVVAPHVHQHSTEECRTEDEIRAQVGIGYEVSLCGVFFCVLLILSLSRQRFNINTIVTNCLVAVFLLSSTLVRNYIITQPKNSSVGVCSRTLMFEYFLLSLVSWFTTSVLEYSSFLHLASLLRNTRLRTTLSRLSRGLGVLVILAVFCVAVCSLNSLGLTIILWESVQESLGGLAQSTLVLVILPVAALIRIARQLFEGMALLSGLTTGLFRQQSPSSRLRFGHVAFSSLILLIHTTIITYTFVAQGDEVWKPAKYGIFIGLCVEFLFRLFTCVWATLNSCCGSRVIDFIESASSPAPRFGPLPNFVPLPHILKSFMHNIIGFIRRYLSHTADDILFFLQLCMFTIKFTISVTLLFVKTMVLRLYHGLFYVLHHVGIIFRYTIHLFLWSGVFVLTLVSRLYHTFINVLVATERLVIGIVVRIVILTFTLVFWLGRVVVGVCNKVGQMWMEFRAPRVQEESDTGHELQEIVYPRMFISDNFKKHLIGNSRPNIRECYVRSNSLRYYIRQFPLDLAEYDELVLTPSSLDFADPPIVGAPFQNIRFQVDAVRCVNDI